MKARTRSEIKQFFSRETVWNKYWWVSKDNKNLLWKTAKSCKHLKANTARISYITKINPNDFLVEILQI